MVQITDVLEEFSAIYFSSENETSVMITILTFFPTAQHPRGALQTKSDQQVSPPLLLHRKCWRLVSFVVLHSVSVGHLELASAQL
jgi:hypothetical protein